MSPSEDESPSEYLTTAQLSGAYTIPVATLRYWRHKGDGPPSFRLGRRVVYRRADVDEWLRAQEAATTRGGQVTV
ncbi:helix-turn-helix transcriptional regulator [Rhodococcus erythropolis]|uniref:Helix-turn-helix domain-containing protein n=1 Tax=Rhodococcus erythropolis TaxID=1833 RepID=A0A8I1D509_RHOER|nr:helix-turn-helix domain-containing protein [Rhodococcus erythropolis]MBH5141436.1 helix-turn-helix domain-containing protein [Rhodococcus erythropolis]